ncbi:MAG: ATP-binding cassette domain-containing protein [Proteobacteria bacterium]|nr:ATP-binding cassette domain-containing protein [Pseudomonadota bacterium]
MLKVENLSLHFKNFSLKDINLTVREKESHILMGPSGSGKTLLLESILGFRKIDRGNIYLDDKIINDIHPSERQIAYVPQDLCLFPHLNVMENILFGCRFTKKCDLNYIEEILEILDIKDLKERKTSSLSGGEKKRVAIARALAIKPKIIFLDEPLSNLDLNLAIDFQAFLKEIKSKINFNMLYVTHNFDEAFFLGDVVSVMINGELKQTSKRDELYFYPKDYSVAKFLGIRNIFKARYEEEFEEDYLLYVYDFNQSIYVNKRPKFPPFEKGKDVHVGIRSDEVMYVRANRKLPDQKNVLNGYVKSIWKRGERGQVIFETKNNVKIEIDIPIGVLRKLELKEGILGEVILKKEAIFIADFRDKK